MSNHDAYIHNGKDVQYQPFIHPEQPVDPSDALVFSGGNGLNQAQSYAYRNTWSRPVYLCRVETNAGFHFGFFEAVRADGVRVSVDDLRINGIAVLQEWR